MYTYSTEWCSSCVLFQHRLSRSDGRYLIVVLRMVKLLGSYAVETVTFLYGKKLWILIY